MRDGGLKFKGHLCFQSEWAGFDEIRLINVIIGRNNCGKSCLLDLIELVATEKDMKPTSIQYAYSAKLDEQAMRQAFHESSSAGKLGGNHWERHGAQLVGVPIYWERTSNDQCLNFEGDIFDG